MSKPGHSLSRIALVNLRRKPFRTNALIVSLSLLTGLIVFALATTFRMDQGIDRALLQMGGDIMVVPLGGYFRS